jgi:hypothetical protein
MKNIDPKDAETSGAVYGIHGGLTLLLAICLAAYDGLEHSYPILIGYMLIGWVIPLALWPFLKKLVSRPVNPIRSAINIYVAPVMLTGGGVLFFLLGIFLPASLVNSIKINGEVIAKSDPRFDHAFFIFRIVFVGMGVIFAIVGYFIFRYIRKRGKNNQVQKPEQ